MSAHANPYIVTDGLAFMYDTGSGKSYKGEPTINYIHAQNAVAKDSYTTYSATSSGTYNAKHPNAIVAYNAAGTQLSGYYNSGVSDATNTYHAHWQYDPILKKPVVVMNDLVGSQWKAKSFGTGLGSWNSQSKSHGDTYTISWLQWVDNLSKNAKAGLYTKNTSGGNGFHDGQANSASSYNTTLYTWQRVYQTYTTSTARDLSQTLASIYMYGHYNVRATVKVADVQFTWGSHPVQFSAEYERSATQGLLDLTGNSTINISNASFDSNAQMIFDGTDDYANVDHQSSYDTNVFTIEAWFKSTADDNTHDSIVTRNGDVYSSTNGWSLGKLRNGLGDTPNALRWLVWGTSAYTGLLGGSATTGNWIHAVGVSDGSTLYLYQNGVLKTSSSKPAGNIYPASYGLKVGANKSGSDVWNGHIDSIKMYNKALTAAEVLQNYNATKGRFS